MKWPLVPLGEVAEIVGGSTPNTNNTRFWNGDIYWATPKDLSDLESHFLDRTVRKITEEGLRSCSAEILPPGSVLFSSRAPIGHVAVTTVPLATNQGFKSFIPKADRLHAKYLFHWLRFSKARLQALGNGATFKELSKATVECIALPLPPLDEQKRIAAILDHADALRAKRRAALAKLDALKESIFLDMFGDPVTNPKGFPLTSLDRACAKITDGTHQPPKWAKSGIPFIFVSNVVDGEIRLNTQKFIDESTYHELTRNTPIEVDDVLYTTVGSYGNVALVKDRRKFAFQRHIAHLKPKQDQFAPSFLAAALQSLGVRRQVDRVARGVAQKTVNLADLKQVRILSPPFATQMAYVRRIAVLGMVEETARVGNQRIETLFSSLQHRAFSGDI